MRSYVIKHANLFIGIDSAFAHFANATNTSAVIFLGYYRLFKSICLILVGIKMEAMQLFITMLLFEKHTVK